MAPPAVHRHRRLCLLFAAAALSSLPGAIAGNDHVGWGFEKTGGFPSNPWQHDYAMNRSTAAYFVGNASGMDSAGELQGEIKLGYMGIGWQLNNIPSHYSHLEKYEIQEAQILKKLRPDLKVSVLRNTEVATVFWDSAKEKMYDPATQDWWTQCPDKKNPGKMAPCVGSWGSPAGNTDKFWFNFSNPALVDWWVNVYIGEAVNNTLFDGVYFDCCCGKAPGVPPSEAAKFAADAQTAFDRALAFIAGAKKWASAWNSDGVITRGSCTTTMTKWLKKGADASVSLQPLAPAFKRTGPAPRPGPPPAPVKCGDSCEITKGMDTHNHGIVSPPVTMPDQTAANVAECCSRCKANTKCEVFELGHGGCVAENCTSKTVNCFLIGGFTGQTNPNNDRAFGCVRGSVAPEPPAAAAAGVEQNNTVAAFMIARGASAMLELPVGGAYENMGMYDVSASILQGDWGAPLGPGKESSPGVYSREYEKATISLDCAKWDSSFSPK